MWIFKTHVITTHHVLQNGSIQDALRFLRHEIHVDDSLAETQAIETPKDSFSETATLL